ncbi:unnamed protein product [Ectocarpus sp. CCAP 1310/34]|nr:unnamed protein product [Ectocarpus sp. CCAP 1310/34]
MSLGHFQFRPCLRSFSRVFFSPGVSRSFSIPISAGIPPFLSGTFFSDSISPDVAIFNFRFSASLCSSGHAHTRCSHGIYSFREIQRVLAELERLLALDTSLVEEKVFVHNLVVGLETAVRSNQIDSGAVWVHDKLMSTTEEGQKTDRDQKVKELSSISKFLTGPKRAAPCRRSLSRPTSAGTGAAASVAAATAAAATAAGPADPPP